MARKTYRKKSSAKRKARGRTVYKVKRGWRVGKRTRKTRAGRRRRRRRSACL